MAKPIGKNVGTVHITDGKDFRVVNTSDFKENADGVYDKFKTVAEFEAEKKAKAKEKADAKKKSDAEKKGKGSK
tara:strand:- start:20204 stop:20425 length:222 start_codon:yes stop_codon:yes gene_type:complete